MTKGIAQRIAKIGLLFVISATLNACVVGAIKKIEDDHSSSQTSSAST